MQNTCKKICVHQKGACYKNGIIEIWEWKKQSQPAFKNALAQEEYNLAQEMYLSKLIGFRVSIEWIVGSIASLNIWIK